MTADTLIAELEESIRTGSASQRTQMLRKVTDAFLADADRLNDRQVDVFDDVLIRLIERIETRALAELSTRLAPIHNAPNEVIQNLARNDEIAVAGPVLMQSRRLSNADLVEIARTKGQTHLSAIAARDQLDVPVTDVLVEYGERDVLHRLVKNPGAVLSEQSFTTLVERAEKNESLAVQLGRRLDIPLRLFRDLLQRATETVRNKLLALTSGNQDDVQRVLANVSAQVAAETAPRDYAAATRLAQMLQERGELNQDAILTFVRANKYEELVAALSLLCGLSLDWVDRLLHAARGDALLIPCKAAGFEWATTRAILKNRPSWKAVSADELDSAWGEYVKLSRATAQRVVRFWQVREAGRGGDAKAASPSAA
jgi:uncharacterized protein (DUF2336 family)